jgi:uncharacterized membrane protein YeiH
MELIQVLDMAGTFAFAVSGAFRAVKYEMDVLGIAVLAIATGIGGGITRDLLLGATPPVALVDERYMLICLFGAATTFWAAPKIARRWDYVLAADAVGLGVFAAIGAVKAEALGAVPMTVALMAVMTACGGGVIRDLLSREIPSILTTGFYASAALLGGITFLLLGIGDISQGTRIFGTVLVTLVARILALRFKVNLPRLKALPSSPSEIARQRRMDSCSRK